MKKKEKKNWLVGSSCTDDDGIILETYTGTENDIRKFLAGKARAARAEDPEGWEYGSTNMKDITKNRDGSLDGCAVFSDSHCDFSARPVKDGELHVTDERIAKAVAMLQDIVMSLDLTEAYEDAKWYIYRDKGFLVNDLDKVVQLLQTGSYKEDNKS